MGVVHGVPAGMCCLCWLTWLANRVKRPLHGVPEGCSTLPAQTSFPSGSVWLSGYQRLSEPAALHQHSSTLLALPCCPAASWHPGGRPAGRFFLRGVADHPDGGGCRRNHPGGGGPGGHDRGHHIGWVGAWRMGGEPMQSLPWWSSVGTGSRGRLAASRCTRWGRALFADG